MIYSQEGTRRVAGARSEDGAAIPKGVEVMVTRYEKGIAYVRPWEDPMEAQWKQGLSEEIMSMENPTIRDRRR